MMFHLNRRALVLGALALPGCTAIDTLNSAAAPRDTYALQPVTAPDQGSRRAGNLLVLLPAAPADIATDRILIRTDPLSVAYLPQARWVDQVPQMLQSVLIRSLAATGKIGFVGAQGSGPVPDVVLLTRIDSFGVDKRASGDFAVSVAIDLTLLRDRDQRVMANTRFASDLAVADDRARTIALGFQQVLDTLLPQAVGWVLGSMR